MVNSGKLMKTGLRIQFYAMKGNTDKMTENTVFNII
jgi:hypothetical protein